MSPLEIVAVVVTLVSVWLTVRQNIWCWPSGLVSVALYAIVFYQTRLYADMGLQVLYAIFSIYGWYEWLHGGEEHSELRVSRVPGILLFIGIVLAAMFTAGLALLLHRFTNASLPWMDSALTSFSLLAQWMMTRKYLENWIVWIVVDVIYVGMFLYKNLYLTAGLYAVFLLLAWRGYVEWKQSRPSVTA